MWLTNLAVSQAQHQVTQITLSPSPPTKSRAQMSNKPSFLRRLAGSLWRYSFGPFFGNIMSDDDDQRMNTEADEPELQRNCEVEAELSNFVGDLAISDPTSDSFTNEEDISPITPELVSSLYNEDVTIQIETAQKIRKLLCDTPNPLRLSLSDEIINSGSVPRFVRLLENSPYPELQFASASVLNSIARGTSAQSQVVMGAGAVPVLIKVLTASSDENVLKNSVKALGNIARHSTKCRHLVLNSNVLSPLLGLFNNGNLSLSMMRRVTWTLARLCKKPHPSFEQVSPCVPLLARLMVNEDEEVFFNACQALSCIFNSSNGQMQVAINSGVCPRLVQLLSHTSTDVVKAALCIVRNISASDDSQTQVIMNANAVPALVSLLSHENESIVEDACFTLFNISLSDGPNDQIQVLIDSGVCPRLVQLLSHTSTHVVMEALCLVCNIAKGDDSQIQVLLNANVLPVLGRFLSHERKSIVKNACRTLANITGGTKQQIQAIINAKLLPPLIELLSHGNIKIRKEAAYAIANATDGQSAEQIAYIVEAGAIPPLCALLSEANSDLIEDALSGLSNILGAGKEISNYSNSTVSITITISVPNAYATFVHQCGGLDKITFLASHDKVKIAQKASTIIEKYFA